MCLKKGVQDPWCILDQRGSPYFMARKKTKAPGVVAGNCTCQNWNLAGPAQSRRDKTWDGHTQWSVPFSTPAADAWSPVSHLKDAHVPVFRRFCANRAAIRTVFRPSFLRTCRLPSKDEIKPPGSCLNKRELARWYKRHLH